jgi:hypothetical protein
VNFHSRPFSAKNKKAVKIPEALHGFNFNLKDQRRNILPVRFHHHQLLRINVLIVVFINFYPLAMWHSYINKKNICQ